jgi:hypothetical protein
MKKSIYAIGGSTMLGRGCSAGFSYLRILKNTFKIDTNTFAEDLITLESALVYIERVPNDSTLLLQIGAGDQLRMLRPNLRSLLPGSWGKSKTGLDQPLYRSKKLHRRLRQRIKSEFKYIIKSLLLKASVYEQETPLRDYQKKLKSLALIAQEKNLRVIWLSTIKGYKRVPNFIRKEKEFYCGYEAFKLVKYYLSNSIFLDLEYFISAQDVLMDGFHLKDSGHHKLAIEVLKVLPD